MKKLVIMLGFCLGLTALPALAATQATPQQSRMAQCNKEAAGKTGAARKTFMKECLAGKTVAAAESAKPAPKADAKPTAAPAKKLTPQQEKMSTCSKEAKAKGLKGEARKKFMSECLRKK